MDRGPGVQMALAETDETQMVKTSKQPMADELPKQGAHKVRTSMFMYIQA